MQEIGGFFELELARGNEYHSSAIRLNTGRNCLEFILRARKYRKIYLPIFICEVILEPIIKLEIDYVFYNIDKNLDPIIKEPILDNEALLYVNYFGLKQNVVIQLSNKINNLIIDNTQAFYAECVDGVDTFYSPRKFFGVPDGGYLYTSSLLNIDFDQDISYNRCEHLLGRIDTGAENHYQTFKVNNAVLRNQPIKTMSNLTRKLLQNIDYDIVSRKRRENFLFLNDLLGDKNELVVELKENSTPMVYPYLVKDGFYLKENLIKNKVYVATYWPNVLKWCQSNYYEHYITNNLIPLPIGPELSIKDLRYINKILKENEF